MYPYRIKNQTCSFKNFLKLPKIFFKALLFFNLACFKLFAQAPHISYNSPQTFVAGVAISPVLPTNTGGALLPSSTALLSYGFNNPTGVAVDRNGNVYVADNSNNAVKKIPFGGGSVITLGSGFSAPTNVAVDTAGNVFLIDYYNNAVKRIAATDGIITTIGAGFNFPYGLAVDVAGNIYVSDRGNNLIKKIAPGNGTITTLASGFNTPCGIAVDAAGNVYVADRGNNAIKKIPVGGGPTVTLASGTGNPNGVAVDAAGNVYFADTYNFTIKKIPAGGGSIVDIGSGFANPAGVAVDAAGNVYVADNGNGAVKEIGIGGGYSVSPALPAGLNLNIGTGAISGTPNSTSAATNYTVTATNSSGSSSFPLSIAVSSTASLSSIIVSTFSSGIRGCAGSPSSSPNIGQFTLSGSNLTANVTATAPAGFEISLAAGTGYGNSIAIPQSGGNISNITVYVRSSATASGNIMGNVILSSTGVISKTVAVYGFINPSSTVNSIANQTVAGGATTTPINFAGTANVFSWVNDTPGIGLPASGTGNIPSFSAINNLTSPVTATITVTPSTSGFAYVPNDNEGTISVINTSTYKLQNTIALGAGAVLRGEAVSPDGSKVYIIDQQARTVSVISTSSNTVLSTISVGSYPVALTLTPDGNTLYVANWYSNEINVINTASNSVISNISLLSVNVYPGALVVSPDGSKLYIANGITDNIVVINTATNAVINNFKVGSQLGQMLFNKDGSLLYVGFHDASAQSAVVVGVINTATNTLIAKIPTSGGNETMAISPDGSRLYVGNLGGNTISVASTVTNSILSTINIDSPGGLSVSADGSQVYVLNSHINKMSIINAANNSVITTIPVGVFPLSTGDFIKQGGCPGVPISFTFTVNPLPPPSINYGSPQTYFTSLPIKPLAPTISVVGAPGYNSNAFSIGTGFSSPSGVAVDAAGNIFVADQDNNAVKKIPVGGGAPVTIGTGFNAPIGVAVDAGGNIYVADQGNNAIKKIPVGGGAPVSLGTGFNSPAGVAVDASGNVFVADQGNNAIKKIPVGGGAPLTLGSGFNQPAGITLDLAGNIYVADAGNYAIKKIPVAGGAPLTLGSGFNQPTGVAVDGFGNVFVADQYNNAVKMIPAGGSNPVTLGSGFNFPGGVAVDGVGNVFIADVLNNAVKKITPNGGYYINPALPGGLNIDHATGVISGTATAANPSTDYAITAYNMHGSGSTTFNITVKALPKPTISYGSSQTYTVGTTISPLTPVSTGVANAAYYNYPISVGSGFNKPNGVASDKNGNIYVSDAGNNLIKKILAAGGAPVNAVSGYTYLTGVAVDNGGNLFISDSWQGILEFPVGGGHLNIGFDSGGPTGVAVDMTGNVYIANPNDNVIKKVYANSNTTITYAGGFSSLLGVAVDFPGNVYVADGTAGTIKKLPYTGGSANIGSGFNTPSGVTVDGAGNVFVADYGNNAIKEIPSGGGSIITIGSGFNGPKGVTTDPAGNLYIADYGNNAIKKVGPVGGYYISPGLPAGLVFDSNTGIISGQPLMNIPPTNYTITAYNAAGISSSATVNITVNYPATTISYNTPNVYNRGATITPLTPASTNVGQYGFGLPLLVGSDFSTITGLAADAAGDIFVADYDHRCIKKIPAAGGAPVILISGILPLSVTADAVGNVYWIDQAYNTVCKFPVGGGNIIVLGTSGSGSGVNYSAAGLAVDSSGNVYFSDFETQGHGVLKEIPLNGSLPIVIASGFGVYLGGVALDAAGNIYVADTYNGVIQKVPAGGGNPIAVIPATGIQNTVAVDLLGNIYYVNEGSGKVNMIPANGGPVISAGQAFSSAHGIAVASNGIIYVGDYGTLVKKIVPSGGFFLNKVLPAGLTFSSSTGIINGTPSALSPATDYTVFAYNVSGAGTSATFNIKVTASADLSNLTISTGNLTPGFAKNITTYTDTVVNLIKSVQVIPTTVDPSATITVNNVAVASGTGSAGIPLNVGANTINVTVTATDGTTIKNYAITVFRAFKYNPIPAQTYGTPDVDPGASSTAGAITYTSSNTSVATIIGGKAHIVGTGTTNIIASDGVMTLAQQLTVSPAPLTLTADNKTRVYGAANPAFTTSYVGFVNGDSQTVLTTQPVLSTSATTASDAGSYPIMIGGATAANYLISYTPGTLTVNPASLNITAASKSKNYGDANPLLTFVYSGFVNTADTSKITVKPIIGTTAQNTSPVGNYPITVSGAVANNYQIIYAAGNLAITAAPLTITADNKSKAYGTANPTLTFSYSGFTNGDTPAVLSVQPIISTAVTLTSPIGSYPITVGGAVASNYLIKNISGILNVTPPNSNLSGLTVSSGRLSPGFAATTTSYIDTVGYATSSISLTPITSDVTATVKVNGVPVNRGAASASIPLAVSNNTITCVVTAGDGVTTKTYTVIVYRKSANYLLSNLSVSSGKLSPAFTTTITSYKDTVSNAISSITVTPTLSNRLANLKVNGILVHSGTASLPIPLLVGSNSISIQVTAEDAGYSYTHTITVNRLPGNALLAGLALSVGKLSPAFVATTTSYIDTVGYATSSISLTPITSDVTATVKVNGVSVSRGAASASFPLAVSNNTITCVVTAGDGVTTKTYTVMVYRKSANYFLSNLTVNSGKLSPAFTTTITSYKDTVSNTISSITVTPTLSNRLASLKVNGILVHSGTASLPIPLLVGSNTISIQVTAEDAGYSYTHTITVTRSPINALLAGLTLSAGKLNPAFVATTTSYIDTVGYSTSSISLTPITSDVTATVKVNGVPVNRGAASASIPLAVSNNTITCVVTAGDGVTTKTYTVIVYRKSANYFLSNLTVNSGKLSPAFTTTITSYKDTVSNTISSITVTPTLSNRLASLKVNGILVHSGTASLPIPLLVGSNTISIQVTAEDAGYSYTHTITVTRLPINALLAGLTLSAGKLNPAFVATTTSYIDTVGYATSSISLTPITSDVTATVKVNGVSVSRGAASASIPLAVSNNTITCVVTAGDGVTTKTYTVIVYRKSANYLLSNLSVSSGKLSPAFTTTITSYKDTVSNTISSITVTPTLSNRFASLKVNGILVHSGTASLPIPLLVGSNTISIQVTAEDAGYSYTHTITVNRLPGNALLAGLLLSSGTLSPAFASGTLSYTSSVSNATSTIGLTPIAADPNATIWVNGLAVTSGYQSPQIALNVGANTILIKVLAADGASTKTYFMTVTRSTAPSALLTNILLSTGTLSPAFSNAVTSYTASVSNSVLSIIVSPIAADSNATVTVNGIILRPWIAPYPIYLSTGSNAIAISVTAADGVTTKTYSLIVTRGATLSSNANISNITLSTGTLTPTFSAGTKSYSSTVSNATAAITIKAFAADTSATVTVNGFTQLNWYGPVWVNLLVGTNTITIHVLATDGLTTNTYIVTVTRSVSGLNNAFLPVTNSGATPLIASLSNERIVANNILSPNSDGVNDIWIVKNIAFYPNNRVSIYDQSGKVVFTTKNYANNWAGTNNGTAIKEGTYFYLIDLGNGTVEKGFITVVRDR